MIDYGGLLDGPGEPIPQPREAAKDKLPALQREADRNRADLESARVILGEYQENIKKGETLLAALFKGMNEGEGIYSLFYKAGVLLSILLNDKAIEAKFESHITTIYGDSFGIHEALELEAEKVQGRLARLRAAALLPHDEREARLIKTAIEAHEARLEEIRRT